MTDAEKKDAAVVAGFAAEMLDAGTHPIIAFVALYVMSLAEDAQAVEVTGELVGQDKDRLLIEITPAPGDLPKLLGKRAEIIEDVRGMAQRMARAYGIYVDIRLRESGNRR